MMVKNRNKQGLTALGRVRAIPSLLNRLIKVRKTQGILTAFILSTATRQLV